MSDLTLPIVYVVIAIVFVLFLGSIRIVEQNTVLVIELLGKFRRVMNAGLSFKVPFLERVAEKVSLRQQNFAIKGRYPSKDKVIVDVSTNLIFAVNPSE